MSTNGYIADMTLSTPDSTKSANDRSVGREPVSVSIVNDYELVVKGVSALLAPFADRVRVVEHEVGGVPSTPVDVALLDTAGDDPKAASRARKTIDRGVCRHLLFYTWDTRRLAPIAASIDGVDGVVSKALTGHDLVVAIERVSRGQETLIFGPEIRTDRPAPLVDPLSHRETQVASLIADGRTNGEIAVALDLSPETVKTYVNRLFIKLGARNRAHAAARAIEMGLHERPSPTVKSA